MPDKADTEKNVVKYERKLGVVTKTKTELDDNRIILPSYCTLSDKLNLRTLNRISAPMVLVLNDSGSSYG